MLRETVGWRRRYKHLADTEPDDDKRFDWRVQAAACAIRETALRDAIKALRTGR